MESIVKMVRCAIWVMLMAVLMGSLFLWTMTSTNTYYVRWLPKIEHKSNNSTYFGNQGASLLTFTFPILLVAVLGCFYVHLGTKLNHTKMGSNGRRSPLAVWRRPMLVRGPLGILSGVELAFFLMFMALLVWSLSSYLHNSFAYINPTSAASEGVSVWQSKLETSALMLGLVGNIAIAFLFFPVSRGSSVLPLFGLTSEASIKYHKWIGHIVMTLFTAHGLCYVIYWAATHQILCMIEWSKTGISNVAGEISLLAGLLLWATTFPKIRRKIFELFFYTHHLYILFMLFFVLHVGISTCCMMLPGFYLFLIDRYLRFLQSRRNVRLLSARVLPCETVELNFSKSPGLKYNPTSIMFVNIPSLSNLQWHPFTITSNSNLEQDKLSVMIKTEGSWSRKLYQMLSSNSSPVGRLEVSIEGPYGPVSTDFLRHDSLVMVSGGSGITPFISIIREFMHLAAELKCKTPNITLICVFKSSSDLTMLNLLLPINGTPSDLSNLQLQIKAYVTRDKAPATSTDESFYSKQLRTIWFKPDSADAPASAILGPNNWLWLGAIITSSFVMFLVLSGVITSYYIYPIDHNTNSKFSTSWRAVINILVMCICIGVAGSVGVLWNKRTHAQEVKQINNFEGLSPMASPLGLGTGNGDSMELESLPHQSLVQATSVHYGERPDLKRMLFECKGSSVGVLVCGPKKMRHDVAAICSSGLEDNLQFESISFSW